MTSPPTKVHLAYTRHKGFTDRVAGGFRAKRCESDVHCHCVIPNETIAAVKVQKTLERNSSCRSFSIAVIEVSNKEPTTEE